MKILKGVGWGAVVGMAIVGIVCVVRLLVFLAATAAQGSPVVMGALLVIVGCAMVGGGVMLLDGGSRPERGRGG